MNDDEMLDGIGVYINCTCHGELIDELGINIPIMLAHDDDAWVEHAMHYGINFQ